MEMFTSIDGWLFLLRWFHLLAGVTWIGLLYYFNFVQAPFFAETEPAIRTGAVTKLVPRALRWFREAAMVTFLTGWIILSLRMHQSAGAFFEFGNNWAIFLGGILGTFMWANVWFVIWPCQKVVIASAQQVAGGGQPLPEAAARARRAALTSRTNVVFSIPMLFFMAASSHLPHLAKPARSAGLLALLCALILIALELNALRGTQGPMKKPLDSIGGTIRLGFVVAIVFYLLFVLLV